MALAEKATTDSRRAELMRVLRPSDRLLPRSPYIGLGLTARQASSYDKVEIAYICFNVFIGEGAHFRNTDPFGLTCLFESLWNCDMKCKIVALKEIPAPWADTASENIRAYGTETVLPNPIGYIKYWIDGDTAISNSYYPLLKLDDKGLRRMPYLIEYLALRSMKDYGFKTVSTSTSPSFFRVGQLARVGIKPSENIEIDEWLEAMLCGMEHHSVPGQHQLQKSSTETITALNNTNK